MKFSLFRSPHRIIAPDRFSGDHHAHWHDRSDNAKTLCRPTKLQTTPMAIFLYSEILVAIFLCFLFLCHLRWNKSRTITNWPVVGMLPGLLQNASNVHEYITWILKQNGGTFKFKGPWFTNMSFMVTSDPRNIHHMLSKNFSNYTKGKNFQEIFDVLGDGIFNSDSDSWTYQRKLLQKFEWFFQQVVKGIVDKSLIPVLDHVSSFGIEVDLQDNFHRFTFDSVCLVALGFDPKCLSIEFPQVSHAKAFDQLEESVFYRHIVPESYWKQQRWLQIGTRRDSVSAGLTWLFWIVATHPYVEAKILGEIKEHLLDKGKLKDFNIDELSKLVYLHVAICESLRLYPPVPFEHKCSVQSDILPSGHSIRPNTTMIYSLYSMVRMESIWGQDCLDFKPERWISERGGIVHLQFFMYAFSIYRSYMIWVGCNFDK
ncbi:cytochrome p450 94c1 [Quercus suber]|uniref:Cytochrome p450 94c1 n=1 Tax=Quercus suber TaxID=58331 RepID=A0AAW0LMF8_QUESU